MKVEIRNLETCRGNETDAFSLEMLVDGELHAYVKNDGWGGCHLYTWMIGTKPAHDSPMRHAIFAWLNETRPASVRFLFEDEDEDSAFYARREALDAYLWGLIEQSKEHETLRKECKGNRKTVYRLKGDPEGQWTVLSVPWTGATKTALEAEHGDKIEEFANERF